MCAPGSDGAPTDRSNPILVCYQQRRDNVLDAACFSGMLDQRDLARIVAFWLKDILRQLLSSRGRSVEALLEAYLSSPLTRNYDYYFFGVGGARYQNGVVLLRNLYKGTPTPVAWHTLRRPYLHMSYVGIALCFLGMYGPDVVDTSALERLLGALHYSQSDSIQVDRAAFLYDLWRGIL